MPSKVIKKRVAQFIQDYGKDILKAINNRPFYFEAVVAQKCAESAFGESELAKEKNNFFGLEAGGGRYQVFHSPLDCFATYVQIVETKFASALSANSPETQLLKMAENGYINTDAMSPQKYVKKIKPLIDAVRELCGIGRVGNSEAKEWEFQVVRNPESELIEKVNVKKII